MVDGVEPNLLLEMSEAEKMKKWAEDNPESAACDDRLRKLSQSMSNK